MPELDGEKNILSTSGDGFVEWRFQVPQAGLYNFEVCYYPLEGKNNDIERDISINGVVPYDDLYAVSFHRVYTDRDDESRLDDNGNALRPVQIEAPRFETFTLSGSLFVVSTPLAVYLNEGEKRCPL